MNKKLSCFVFLFLLTINLRVTAGDDFQKLLDDAGLTFAKPEGFEKTNTSANPLMKFDAAYKHKSRDVEVRYLINNVKDVPGKRDPGLCESLFVNIVIRFTKDTKSGMELNAGDLNADWGLFAEVELKEEFGGKYKYCTAVGLSKFTSADVYLFILYNDNTELSKDFENLIYSLKFK